MPEANTAYVYKQLCRLETKLGKVQAFHEKGCPVNVALNELYYELKQFGALIDEKRWQGGAESDQEWTEIYEKYNKLLAIFGSIAAENCPKDQGIVFASESAIPRFLYKITHSHKALWSRFETIATAFGIGIIGFTLLIITYFLAGGEIAFLSRLAKSMTVANCVAAVIGVVLGLCVHEFAHGIVLANNGIKIRRVGAMAGAIVGGFVEADEKTFLEADPKVHLRFNASSIGINALLAVILGFSGYLISSELVMSLALGNLLFGIINSLPVSPFDGGWVFEDLMKMYVKKETVRKVFSISRLLILLLWFILFTRFCLSIG